MIRMSDMSEPQMEIIGSGRPSRASNKVDGNKGARELAIPVSADAPATGACDDLYAPSDLAAMRDGRLCPDGIQRLAKHLVQCRTCKLFVATMAAEACQAESTGSHPPAPERDSAARRTDQEPAKVSIAAGR
jgi:hypothetical protein